MPPYTAAKAALCGLTHSLAYDYGRHNIRVNSVCPASVKTSLFAQMVKDMHMSPEEEKAYTQNTPVSYPLGRRGEPEEVAKAMLFLACDDSSFITGKNMIIDGGYWAGLPIQ